MEERHQQKKKRDVLNQQRRGAQMVVVRVEKVQLIKRAARTLNFNDDIGVARPGRLVTCK